MRNQLTILAGIVALMGTALAFAAPPKGVAQASNESSAGCPIPTLAQRDVLVASDECYAEFTWNGSATTILRHGTQGVLAGALAEQAGQLRRRAHRLLRR